jgi:hypothetical protein
MNTEFCSGNPEERKPQAKGMKKCSYVIMAETDDQNM